MKTKQQIRNQIKNIYVWKRTMKTASVEAGYSPKQLQLPLQIADTAIQALKWALEYKLPKEGYYWCFRCQIRHLGLTCPSCGGNTPLPEASKESPKE